MLPNLLSYEDSVQTAADTARQLGVSKFTLLRMRQAEGCSGLPFVQISPGRIGYLKSDVRAYLAARRVGTLPEVTMIQADTGEAAASVFTEFTIRRGDSATK
jgi:DNA-binding MurR/RpiR family transcriptional regulator